MADYDLVVIGSGAAGQTAATTAVRLGAGRVAIVDRGPRWGTCVNAGCIPSKYLLTLAEYHYYRGHGLAGLGMESRFDLPAALAGKADLIRQLDRKKDDRILSGLRIDLIEESAAFLSPQALQAGDRTITADRFIIATGSAPQVPPFPGIRNVPFLTSAEALGPDRIPQSLIVVGGRALGLEFAQLYAHLGSEVTLLQRSPRIIPDEEPEIADMLAGYLRNEGIGILTGADIRGVAKTETGVAVTVAGGGAESVVAAEALLLATGRSPNTEGLALERAGLKTGPSGAVIVDAALRTSAPSIWAAGDVTGEPMLETAARYAGEIAAVNAFTGNTRTFDRAHLPHGIYTMPQVASVGLTEAMAKKAGLDPDSRILRMDAIARNRMTGDTRGMVKIVAARNDGRLLGVHVCSPLATEMLQGAVLAVNRQMPVEELAGLYNIFPTASEAISVCAARFREKGA